MPHKKPAKPVKSKPKAKPVKSKPKAKPFKAKPNGLAFNPREFSFLDRKYGPTHTREPPRYGPVYGRKLKILKRANSPKKKGIKKNY